MQLRVLFLSAVSFGIRLEVEQVLQRLNFDLIIWVQNLLLRPVKLNFAG